MWAQVHYHISDDSVMQFQLSAVCCGNATRNVALHWQWQGIKKHLLASLDVNNAGSEICTKPFFYFCISKIVFSVRPQGYTECDVVTNRI